jgi:hypothetical protein
MSAAKAAGDEPAYEAAEAVNVVWLDETFRFPGEVTAEIKFIVADAPVDLAALVAEAKSAEVLAAITTAKVDVSTVAEMFGDPWKGSRQAQEALFAAFPSYVPGYVPPEKKPGEVVS